MIAEIGIDFFADVDEKVSVFLLVTRNHLHKQLDY